MLVNPVEPATAPIPRSPIGHRYSSLAVTSTEGISARGPQTGVLGAPKLHIYGPPAHMGGLSPAVQGHRRSFMGHLAKVLAAAAFPGKRGGRAGDSGVAEGAAELLGAT